MLILIVFPNSAQKRFKFH